MTRPINVLVFVGIAIWTLLGLGAWAIVSLGGDFFHAQLDWLFLGDPNLVAAMSWLVRVLQGLGLGVIFVIWALGSAAIWLAGLVMRRIAVGIAASMDRDPRWDDFRRPDPIDRPMKDVTPRDVPPRALPHD